MKSYCLLFEMEDGKVMKTGEYVGEDVLLAVRKECEEKGHKYLGRVEGHLLGMLEDILAGKMIK